MTLKDFATDKKTGKLKRGAISRIAEHQGVCFNTVKHWLNGEWKVSVERSRQIQDMIHRRVSLTAKKTGPKQQVVKQSRNGVKKIRVTQVAKR